MQQNTPEQRPDPPVSDPGQSGPENEPYTSEEWNVLLETPVTICRAIMAVSPSGIIGMSQEVLTMRKSLKEVLQHASSPLLQQLHQQLQSQEKAEALWREIQRFFKDRQDTVAIRQTAIAACQRCVLLLNKAPAQESQAYKEFVYAMARRVAEAAREGGFLGTGGQAISEAEQALLKELSSVLGIPGA
jgi:hypothetical protein